MTDQPTDQQSEQQNEQPLPAHPGKIVYVDGYTDAVTAEFDAEAFPEDLRFIDTDSGPQPLVRIVEYAKDKITEQYLYGPDGDLLMTRTLATE